MFEIFKKTIRRIAPKALGGLGAILLLISSFFTVSAVEVPNYHFSVARPTVNGSSCYFEILHADGSCGILYISGQGNVGYSNFYLNGTGTELLVSLATSNSLFGSYIFEDGSFIPYAEENTMLWTQTFPSDRRIVGLHYYGVQPSYGNNSGGSILLSNFTVSYGDDTKANDLLNDILSSSNVYYAEALSSREESMFPTIGGIQYIRSGFAQSSYFTDVTSRFGTSFCVLENSSASPSIRFNWLYQHNTIPARSQLYAYFSLYFNSYVSLNSISLRVFRLPTGFRFSGNGSILDLMHNSSVVGTFSFSNVNSGVINVTFNSSSSNFLCFVIPITNISEISSTSSNSDDYDTFNFSVASVSPNGLDSAEKTVELEEEKAQQKGTEAQTNNNQTANDNDKSAGFISSLNALVTAMSYNGTDAVLTVPEVYLPAIPNVMARKTLIEPFSVNLTSWVDRIPSALLSIIRALGDIGIIVFCFKEFYSLIQYIVSLRGND